MKNCWHEKDFMRIFITVSSSPDAVDIPPCLLYNKENNISRGIGATQRERHLTAPEYIEKGIHHV